MEKLKIFFDEMAKTSTEIVWRPVYTALWKISKSPIQCTQAIIVIHWVVDIEFFFGR